MLRVRRLGRVGYEEADALQRALAARSSDDYLLALEHPHVYTLGVRADPGHVLVDPASVGASLVRTDRGGDVTYHGPGQLVLYPVVTLTDGPGAGPDHVHRLEQVVIEALGDLGVDGVGRLAGYPGVWLGADGTDPAKVAAVGVRTPRIEGVRRTLHGMALNVDCDLAMFGHIVPCGLADRPVTSLAARGFDLRMDEVTEAVLRRAVAAWAGEGAVDRQDVTPPGRAAIEVDERALLRRLRRSGVDPAAGLPISARKPPWLRAPVRRDDGYRRVDRTLRDLRLTTVCEEAGCPNISECWADGTATFMINGSRCTRACGFCLVDTRHPLPLEANEPERVAEAVERMRLAHAVVTCVARDDLPDGGAEAMAATVDAVRRRCPATTVEVLVSDYQGDAAALAAVVSAAPDVLNHNVETVARLQRAVRPNAGYARSLALLARAADAGLVVKSGLMVGLGETADEVVATLADLRAVGVSIGTVGQYLRPSRDHLPVARFWTPAEFDELRAAALALGFDHLQASPLTRSSYHARQAAVAAAGGASGVPVLLAPRR